MTVMQRTKASGTFEELLAFDSPPRVTSQTLWPLALFVAWSFDFLFWGRRPGISFPIFIALLLIGGALIARSTSSRVAGGSLWLIAFIVALSVGSTLRAEPLTVALDYLATIFMVGVLADSMTTGRWVR